MEPNRFLAHTTKEKTNLFACKFIYFAVFLRLNTQFQMALHLPALRTGMSDIRIRQTKVRQMLQNLDVKLVHPMLFQLLFLRSVPLIGLLY